MLFEQPFFGKMLMIDGATQISAKDEFIYQEMMSHVPLFAHGKAHEVLIIGGGDCGIAEEVLKHKAITRVTQVEIDAKVVELSKEHFPEITKPPFADRRFESVIDDGEIRRANRTALRRIIVDSTDPQGPGKILFSQKFYRACKLHEQGWPDGDTERGADVATARTASSIGKFHRLFKDAIATSPRFPLTSAAIWPWAWRPTTAPATDARRDPHRTLPQSRRLCDEILDAGVHGTTFALPRFIADAAAKTKSRR